jgi:hypothetical protein
MMTLLITTLLIIAILIALNTGDYNDIAYNIYKCNIT